MSKLSKELEQGVVIDGVEYVRKAPLIKVLLDEGLEANIIDETFKKYLSSILLEGEIEIVKHIIESNAKSLKLLTGEEKLQRYDMLVNGLVAGIKKQKADKNYELVIELMEEKEHLLKEKHKLENRLNGAAKAKLTKQLKNMQPIEVTKGLPTYVDDKLIFINYYPYSVNTMYSSVDSEGHYVFKSKYTNWFRNFPIHELEPIAKFKDRVDITKPMILYLRFGLTPERDVDNHIKSIQDRIAKFYNFEDSKIRTVMADAVDVESDNLQWISYWIENL